MVLKRSKPGWRLRARWCILVGGTKQQWHEAVVQLFGQESVTERIRVMVPLGNYQCVAIRHRIESRREFDDFESRSSRQTNQFVSAGLFPTFEI
jgi:hypothetical protein